MGEVYWCHNICLFFVLLVLCKPTSPFSTISVDGVEGKVISSLHCCLLPWFTLPCCSTSLVNISFLHFSLTKHPAQCPFSYFCVFASLPRSEPLMCTVNKRKADFVLATYSTWMLLFRYFHYCSLLTVPGLWQTWQRRQTLDRPLHCSHWSHSQSNLADLRSTNVQRHPPRVFVCPVIAIVFGISGYFSSFTSWSWQFAIHCASGDNLWRCRGHRTRHNGCSWSYLSHALETTIGSLGKFSYSSLWETNGGYCNPEHVVWVNRYSVC